LGNESAINPGSPLNVSYANVGYEYVRDDSGILIGDNSIPV